MPPEFAPKKIHYDEDERIIAPVVIIGATAVVVVAGLIPAYFIVVSYTGHYFILNIAFKIVMIGITTKLGMPIVFSNEYLLPAHYNVPPPPPPPPPPADVSSFFRTKL